MTNLKISEEVANYLIRADFCADPAFACTDLKSTPASVFAEQAMLQVLTKGAEYYLLNGNRIKYSSLKNYGWYIVEIDTSANPAPVLVKRVRRSNRNEGRTRAEMIGKTLMIRFDAALSKSVADRLPGLSKLPPSLTSYKTHSYAWSKADFLAMLRKHHAESFSTYADSSLMLAICHRVQCFNKLAPTA